MTTLAVQAGHILRAGEIEDAIDEALAVVPLGYLAHTFEGSDQLIANADTPFMSTGVAFNVGPSRRVKTTWSGVITSSDAGDTILVFIALEPGGDPAMRTRATVVTDFADLPGSIIMYTEPDEGLNTYQVYVQRPFGTGTGGFRAGALLLVEDIGPA